MSIEWLDATTAWCMGCASEFNPFEESHSGHGLVDEPKPVKVVLHRTGGRAIGYWWDSPDGRQFDIRREDLFDPSSTYGWTICEIGDDSIGKNWHVLSTMPRLKDIRVELRRLYETGIRA